MKHNTLPADLIREMEQFAHLATKKARPAHAAWKADEHKLDHPTPGTVPYPAAEVFKRKQAAKAQHRATFPLDDELTTHAAALAEVRRSLDLNELVSNARFLPPIADGGDALTRDMRVIADATLRDGYVRRLARMSPERLADEAMRAARAAGADPTSNDALARLDAIREVAESKPGEGWAPARGAVGAALSHVESRWQERNALLASITTAEGLIDEATTYGHSIRDGIDSPRLKYFEHRAAQQKAA